MKISNSKRKQGHIDKFVKFMDERVGGRYLTKNFFSDISAEELEYLIKTMRKHGRVMDVLQSWVNVHKAGSAEIDVQDCEEIMNIFAIKEVQET